LHAPPADRGVGDRPDFDVASQPSDVRAAIELVFQHPSLDGQLTARENQCRARGEAFIIVP
jgi:hypothetical protein